MPSKSSPADTHPALGSVIDNGTLELVEVLGVGGYGVVYRAVVIGSSPPQSFAVKCLLHGDSPSSRKRHIHLREIMLHRLAGAHPNVVTLHKVVEEGKYTFIVLDFASAHDLFTQILHGRQYLGNDEIIRHVFLQLLDAVEYCHSLGIYHRDLKPENVLCFDDGLRVAITDFGLATTDKMSMEFRTGSIYHMSPECHAGPASYSPPANDIWSLGIILINLITGRNPFRSSSMDDPTFQCFLHNPSGFLPTVLPLSQEVNMLLSRMLAIDWRNRLPLTAIRRAILAIPSFYSPGAILEGSMARCPWEAPMEVDEEDVSAGSPSTHADQHTIDCEDEEDSSVSEDSFLKSRWSQDSKDSLRPSVNIVAPEFSSPIPSRIEARQSWSTCVDGVLDSSCARVRSSNSGSSEPLSRVDSDLPSWPVTPGSQVTSFVEAVMEQPQRQRLTIDTGAAIQRRTCSDSSSMIFSALEALNESLSFSPTKVNRMSGIEVHNPSWDDDNDVVNHDIEFISPVAADWKMLDGPLSGIPGSPVSSSTTLSSFCAPCPSSAITLSFQDSFYSPHFRSRGNNLFQTHEDDISIPCSQELGGQPPQEQHSFPSQRQHQKWLSESDAAAWPSSATTIKFSPNPTTTNSQTSGVFVSTQSFPFQPHNGFARETPSSFWPTSASGEVKEVLNDDNKTPDHHHPSSSTGSVGTLAVSSSPHHRRTPFRWFTGFRTNIFA